MKKRHKQFEFGGKDFGRPGDAFGGSLLKGNPKTRRPLDSKLPLHLTLRAGRSCLRLPKTFKTVADTVAGTAAKYGVTIYEQANVGNHLHVLLKVTSPRIWRAFIRELTGRIAQLVGALLAGLRDGSAGGPGFWKFRPHTRIVRGWRKPFETARAYIQLNQLEAEGFISRRETKTLKDLRAIFTDG